MLFDVPEGWTAVLDFASSGEPHSYLLKSDDGRICDLVASHGDEPPAMEEFVSLVRSWDRAEIKVGVDRAHNVALVDDSERTSDWTSITCDSTEVAQFMATRVWVSP